MVSPADDIEFLARHGVPVPVLRAAGELARREGVPGHEALIKSGTMAETAFYRALAAELGFAFVASARLVGGAAHFPGSIVAGIAPLRPNSAGARFAIAPRGREVGAMLGRRPHGRGVAIMAPGALRDGVFLAAHAAIARHASDALSDARPTLSARSGLSVGQAIAVLGTVLLVSAAATLAPAVTFTTLTTLLAVAFLPMVVLRLAALQVDARTRATRPPARWADAALPVYTIIVPLHRERRVLPRLLASLEALDYPAAKRDVKLVVEADDTETLEALAGSRLPPTVEVIVAPPGAPRTKPRALNVALPLARGAFTVVYDAEDVPDPDQLRLAVAAFAREPREVACLQARLVIDNVGDGWLARCCALEYGALFDVVNPALAAYRWPMLLGGTSNHFRTETLQALHGWDPWNVTEDADLGLRLARLGFRVGDLASSTIEEAPASFGGWFRQRSRWMKGFMQTCAVHTRQPVATARALGWGGTGAATMQSFGTVLTALLYPFLTILAVAQFVDGAMFSAAGPFEILSTALGSVLFVSGALAMLAPPFLGAWRRRWWGLLPVVATLPLYYALISLAAWRALWEYLDQPHHWHKTEHGLARTSRSGRLAL